MRPDPTKPSDPVPPRRSTGRRTVAIVAAVLVPLVAAAFVVVRFGGPTLTNLFGGSRAPADPFAGTPAEGYPSGEAGIVVPAAAEVPGFTADEVAAALQTVRQALIAGRLDERMLYDHDPSALRALFSRLGALDLDRMFEDDLAGIVATMIAPGHTLTDHPVRVSGTMSFTGVTRADIRWLEIHTIFVWVYPFSGPSPKPGDDQLVTVKDDIYWLFPAAEDVYPDDTGLYLGGRSTSYAHNIDCDLLEQSLIAPGRTEAGTQRAEVDLNEVMDPSSTVYLPENC